MGVGGNAIPANLYKGVTSNCIQCVLEKTKLTKISLILNKIMQKVLWLFVDTVYL